MYPTNELAQEQFGGMQYAVLVKLLGGQQALPRFVQNSRGHLVTSSHLLLSTLQVWPAGQQTPEQIDRPEGQHWPPTQVSPALQQVVPQARAAVQHCPVAGLTQTGARSGQQVPPVREVEQYFASGQQGPSSAVMPVPSERVPVGQQRTSPTLVNHWRSGGQHS